MIRLVFILFAFVACSTSGDLRDLRGPCTDGGTMALPNTVNTVYAPGSQVKSYDLNDMQQCIAGSKHKSRRIWMAPSPSESSAVNNGASGVIATGAGGFSHPVGCLWVGQRITGYAIKALGVNTGNPDFHIQLERNPGDGSTDTLDFTTFTDSAAGGLLFEKTLAAPHVTLDGNTYFFVVGLDVAGQTIFGFAIDVDVL